MLNPLRFRIDFNLAKTYIMLKLNLVLEFKINCPDAEEHVVSSSNFQPNIYGSYVTHGSSRYEQKTIIFGWHQCSWRNIESKIVPFLIMVVEKLLRVNLEYWNGKGSHRLQTKITGP